MNQAQERQHNQPCEDCTKCGGPRVWKLWKSGLWMRYCSACESTRATNRRKANPDRHRENCRRWKKANPDKNREHCRRYKKANREKVREANRRWEQANPDKTRAANARRRARMAEVEDDGWSFEALTKMMRTGEHTCFICEKATATEVEHLMPLSLGGGNVWANLSLACKSCNSAKGGTNRADHLYPGSSGWEAFLAERRA